MEWATVTFFPIQHFFASYVQSCATFSTAKRTRTSHLVHR
ncbi:Hypothetical protein PHPALM_12669 [Phytophthora palmivora]|uniref:Uncharacterized protein n=1 Tax=Phytophthora palmivora TaxID=4796 RepID=A0A2P4XZB7_9STRA|nr:Hypothetical protein PHPALM_12669 [Phytophthora palmivora]